MHPRDLASLASETTIFGGFAAEKLKHLQAELEPLSRRYDVVVANPPYMGSKNMNKRLGDWVKKHYKDVKGDLFSCFMVRNVGMGAEHAQLGFMTPYVWMFIGTYEKLRKFVIQQNTITSLIQLEYSGFSGATVPICTFTLQKGYCPGYRGGYVRLSDFVGADQQAPRALEALANPDCGWFYRADASGFGAIPGSPIAYWVSKAEAEAFKCDTLGEMLITREGMATADNDRFLRCWAEVGINTIGFGCESPLDAAQSKMKWFPYQKGGEFRKWFGNNDFVVNWENDGFEIRNNIDPNTKRTRSHNYNGDYGFRESATWSALSSASIHVRYAPRGSLFDSKGAKGFAETTEKLMYSIALVNSSSAKRFLKFLAPTLDFKVGDIAKLPNPKQRVAAIAAIAEECVAMAKSDYDAFEESWDFSKHPLI